MRGSGVFARPLSWSPAATASDRGRNARAPDRDATADPLDCGGWRVQAAASFEPEDEGGFVLVAHPGGDVVAVWIGAGQDGQFLSWARLAGGRLRVDPEPILAWTGPPVFHPSGREFLTTSLDLLSHLPMAQPADVLRTFAVSRLLLDNFDHVKVFWVMHGVSTSQLALNYGADDMDG